MGSLVNVNNNNNYYNNNNSNNNNNDDDDDDDDDTKLILRLIQRLWVLYNSTNLSENLAWSQVKILFSVKTGLSSQVIKSNV